MRDIDRCKKEFEAWREIQTGPIAVGDVWKAAWNRRAAPVVTNEMVNRAYLAFNSGGHADTYEAWRAALTAALDPDNA